jgi:hypothetical protein
VKEQIMRRLIIGFASVSVAVIATAQQALQCVNPDVLNSLVFNANRESRVVINRGMPANATGFRAPAEFSLIGSAVRGQDFPSTVVAYRTSLERGKAFDSLLGFLAGEGWNRESSAQAQLAVSFDGQQSTSATLCRNGERRRVQIQEVDGVRYATLTGVRIDLARACGVPSPQADVNPLGGMEARSAIMPRFSFPETARTSGERPGGMRFGGSENSSSVRIQSPDTAASLASNLARQLREQGWRGDAEWKGPLSTGSTWLRRNDAGQTFWGTLEVLNLGNGVYDVGFSAASRR